MMYSSIDENINLRDEFDVSDEGKELSSLKILEGMTELQLLKYPISL